MTITFGYIDFMQVYPCLARHFEKKAVELAGCR